MGSCIWKTSIFSFKNSFAQPNDDGSPFILLFWGLFWFWFLRLFWDVMMYDWIWSTVVMVVGLWLIWGRGRSNDISYEGLVICGHISFNSFWFSRQLVKVNKTLSNIYLEMSRLFWRKWWFPILMSCKLLWGPLVDRLWTDGSKYFIKP